MHIYNFSCCIFLILLLLLLPLLFKIDLMVSIQTARPLTLNSEKSRRMCTSP